jgi:hypothetical protein
MSPRAPLIAVVSTRRLDEDDVRARVVIVRAGKEPQVLSPHYSDMTHAQVVLAAAESLVRTSLKGNLPLRIILPDDTAVRLLQYGGATKGRQVGQQVARIRQLVRDQDALVTFERGTLYSVVGDAAEDIDVW